MQMPQNSGGTVHVHDSLTICTLLLRAAQRHMAANTNTREAVELPHHHCATKFMVVFIAANTLLQMTTGLSIRVAAYFPGSTQQAS